jgi:hypothetical protein
MNPPEIASFAEIVAYLGLGTSLTPADAGLLQMLKSMVENEARAHCGHDITQPAEPYVHDLPAAGLRAADDPLLEDGLTSDGEPAANVLQLPQLFVRSDDLEVRIDPNASGGQSEGAFGPDSLLERGVDYLLDLDESTFSRTGQLIRLGGSWPARPRTIRVTYRAGLTVAELDGAFSDIKYAVIEEAAGRFRAARRRQAAGGVIKSESIGGEYSVTYESMPTESGESRGATLAMRLAPYARMVP